MFLSYKWQILPGGNGGVQGPREISREISENTERLKAQLTQAQFALMEPFLEQMTLSRSMELESRFCFGFAAGIRLQQKGNAFFSGRKQLW